MRQVKQRPIQIAPSDEYVMVAVPQWVVPYITGLMVSLQDHKRIDSAGASRVRGAMATMGGNMQSSVLVDQLRMAEQSTPPSTPDAGQLVIYAENGSILRTLRPGGSQGQIAELDRAQTWSNPQKLSAPSQTTPYLQITTDPNIPPVMAASFALLEMNASGQSGVALDSASDTAVYGSTIYMRRSRGTVAVRNNVQNNDKIGEIQAGGRVGDAYRIGARIMFFASATPANNRLPTEIQFLTAAEDHDARRALRIRRTGAVWIGDFASSTLDSEGDIAALGRVSGAAFYVGTNQVIGARGAAVPDASGGTVIDVEARAALNALLSRLRAHGLIA